jgi:hypothetical protein
LGSEQFQSETNWRVFGLGAAFFIAYLALVFVWMMILETIRGA